MSRKTFRSEFKNFFILFHIFGLARFSDNPYISSLLFVYSVIQALIFFALLTSVVVLKITFDANAISTIVNYVFLGSVTLTPFVIMLQTIFDTNKQHSLVTSIDQIDELIHRKLGHHFNYAREKRSIWLKILLVVIILGFIQSFLIYRLYRLSSLGTLYPAYYSFLLIWMRSIQIAFYMLLLNDRLKIVDEKLAEFRNTTGLSLNKWPVAQDTTTDKLNMIFVFHSSFSKGSKRERFLNLKRIYGKLFDISNLVNASFGLSLLAIFTHSLIDITTFAYLLFIAINDIDINYDLLIISICLMLPAIIVTAVIAYSCSNCFKTVSLLRCFQIIFCLSSRLNFKSLSIGNNIHRIERDVSDERFNSLVQEFALQIAYEPIIISASGYFNMDLEMLGSVR